jgi:multidrug efflux pump subunit AcrA (membrane-fusion protein)
MENGTVSNKHRNELISSEMQELISYRPHWIIRKGNALFVLILTVILASTCLIKYPDVIKGSMIITAIDAPKLLLAKTDCKLEKLLVKNEEEVTQGQALALLQSTASHWIQQYTIVAPEDGKVLFSSFLEDNQLLSQGQELFYVQPEESNYFGQLMVPQTGFGEIKVGQRVLVRLDSYPSSEFGYIAGEIEYISNISTAKDSFLIKVDFPKGLQTNYNKKIVFRNNLSGQAEVMTDDHKLLERFLDQLKDLTKR